MRDYISPPDLRRIRAQRLTAAIMQEIRPFIKDDNQSDIHHAVYDLLWRTGADMITDADRIAAGLPDRGNLGYTNDELRLMEARKMELMITPSFGQPNRTRDSDSD